MQCHVTVRSCAMPTLLLHHRLLLPSFPQVDEDFLLQYQLNYGSTAWSVHQDEGGNLYYFNNNTGDSQWTAPPGFTASTQPTQPQEQQQGTTPNIPATGAETTTTADAVSRKRKTTGDKITGIGAGGKARPNAAMYVQGLPTDDDFTLDEFAQYMAKCGILALDEEGRPHAKLYKNEDGSLKGDGRCRYLKIESVPLALTLLDGSEVRPGHTISVQQAVFQPKSADAVASLSSTEDKPKKKQKKNPVFAANKKRQEK